MNKKRFVNFANYLESFTARVVSRYPETKDFIEAEKGNMLERFPELATQQFQTEVSTYEKVKNTLKYSVDMTRRQCYHELQVKRNNPKEIIEYQFTISRYWQCSQGHLILFPTLRRTFTSIKGFKHS